MITRSSVCLSMIVRNEAHVIARALKSVRPHIDHYVIVDTGSTDNTKDVIRETLSDIDGEIIDRPWKDFGHNRTEALELCRDKAEYTMVIDADDEITGTKPLRLIHDEYQLKIIDVGTSYTYVRPHIFRSDLPYRYVGRIHEYLSCDKPIAMENKAILPNLVYRRHTNEGARSIGDVRAKYARDAEILEAVLKEEPNHPDTARHMYYLGQSYRDAGMEDKAIEAFERRATMGGYQEEAFAGLRYIAEYTLVRELQTNDKPDDDAVARIEHAYMRAYEYRPTRIEPIVDLCDFLNKQQRFARSHMLSKSLLDVPMTKDTWLVQPDDYNWRLKDLYATAAYYVGDKHACRLVYEELLRSKKTPIDQLERMQKNLSFCAEIGELAFPTRHVARNHEESDFGPFLDQLKKHIGAGSSELGTHLMLFSLAVSTRAETIVEIGRFRGRSTYALANALKFLKIGWQEVPESHQRPGIDYERLERGVIDRKLYSIEAYPLPEVKTMIADFGLEEFLCWIDKPSGLVTPEDLDGKKIDLCFVDGDHSYQGCLDDVMRFAPMIADGKYMILHDFFGWYQPDGTNGSPIKQVCDAIADDFEHVLLDTSYMSFMLFRKRDKASARASAPAPAAKALLEVVVPRIAKKYWEPRAEVIAYVERLIQPGWKVLEIGPGAIPFSKATHFVDRPSEGQFVMRPNTTCLDVNADKLPFADKEYDFIFCRHVVEDLYNPDLLLKEMNRVGRRGYIETPSALVELTRGVDGGDNPPHRGYIHHRSIVWDHDGVLQLVEKATCIEHMDLEDKSMVLTDPMQWNCYFLWDGELKYRHLQHDIDFKLHVNYGEVLSDAVAAAISSAKAMSSRVR